MKIETLIVAALSTIDTGDDNLWTSDGLPRVEVVQAVVDRELSGTGAAPVKLTRQLVTSAAPEFTRSSPLLPASEPGDHPPVEDDSDQPAPGELDTEAAPDEAVASGVAAQIIAGVPIVVDGEVPSTEDAEANAKARESLAAMKAELVAKRDQLAKAADKIASDLRVLDAEIDACDRADRTIAPRPNAATNIQQYQRRQQELAMARAGSVRPVPGVDFRPRQAAPRVPSVNH